jgi:hypothetical protein
MNTLRFVNNELPFVDYSDLLTKIHEFLLEQNPYQLKNEAPNKFFIDLDKISAKVAEKQINNPLIKGDYVRSSTVNINDKMLLNFNQKIRDIEQLLQEKLNAILGERSAGEFINSFISDLKNFQKTQVDLNFTYSFKGSELQKESLTMSSEHSENGTKKPNLKAHKLTITISNTKEMKEQIKAGLKNYIQTKFGNYDAEDLAELEEILSKDHQNIDQLIDILDKETLGKLKQEAQILYLKFLAHNVKLNHEDSDTDEPNTNDLGAKHLYDLIDRLEKMLKFIEEEGDVNLEYGGYSVDLKEIFYQSNVFDMLPIIPIVDGSIGETTDTENGKREFIFGMSVKLNGPVQTANKNSAFDYYTDLLNPQSPEHQEELKNKKDSFVRKLFKLLLCYYFVYANPVKLQTTEFDVTESFKQKILPIFTGKNEENKQKLLAKMLEGFNILNVSKKINELKQVIQKLLKRTTLEPLQETLSIRVKTGILEKKIDQIIENRTFFDNIINENPKKSLRFITIESQNINPNSVCTLPTDVQINDIFFYRSENSETFNMNYAYDKLKLLPIVFVPHQVLEDEQKYRINAKFKNVKSLMFIYDSERFPKEQDIYEKGTSKSFIYCFTYSLLAYITLHILLKNASKADKSLMIGMLRLHLGDKETPKPVEKFLGYFSKVLSHLLNDKYRANSQGIDIKNSQYRILNTMSSLYSSVPKEFTGIKINEIHKLAIVVVSGRETDKLRDNRSKEKITNLMGEIILCQNSGGKVRLTPVKTFSDNYNQDEIYKEPKVLTDLIDYLYNSGYKHFIYVAKSPHSSYLHITKKDEDDGLFFMSKEIMMIIKKDYEDMKIYPMFFDLYPTTKIYNCPKGAFYIQDTKVLSRIMQDNTQESVVFFNLFNGISVQKNTVYNRVISYTTLLNTYGSVLKNTDIYSGLIDDTPEKSDILHYLTLWHFSSYEKYEKTTEKPSFKLNPYEDLIGDESVGKKSIFKHPSGGVNFNSLAFLTVVKQILDSEQESE